MRCFRSRALRKVSGRFETPVLATVVPGVGAAVCLLVNVGNAGLFLGLSSVCIMLLYIAYLMVTVPMLIGRLRGRALPTGSDEAGRPLFSLGRWGMAVNVLAVVYGLAMAINLGLPRTEVYDPTNAGWYLHYLPLLTLGLTAVIGGIAFLVKRSAYLAAIGEQAPAHVHHDAIALRGLALEESA